MTASTSGARRSRGRVIGSGTMLVAPVRSAQATIGRGLDDHQGHGPTTGYARASKQVTIESWKRRSGNRGNRGHSRFPGDYPETENVPIPYFPQRLISPASPRSPGRSRRGCSRPSGSSGLVREHDEAARHVCRCSTSTSRSRCSPEPGSHARPRHQQRRAQLRRAIEWLCSRQRVSAPRAGHPGCARVVDDVTGRPLRLRS